MGKLVLHFYAAVAALFILLPICAPADDSHWHVPAAPPPDLWAKTVPKTDAATEGGIAHSVQLSLGSDLAFRGQSLTGGHGYASAGYAANYAPDKASAIGGGAFFVSEYNHDRMERPVYGYWATATRETGLGLLAMNAFYFDISNDDDMLTVEFGDEITRRVAKGVTFQASFAAAPDALSTFGNMLYVRAGWKIDPSPRTLGWSLKAFAGHQWIEDNEGFGTPDYADFELTLARTWRKIDISITGTASDVARKDCFDGAKDCEPRLFLTLAHSLGF